MEHNLTDILLDDYSQQNNRSSRKHDSQFWQIRYSAAIFGNSFFPTTINPLDPTRPKAPGCLLPRAPESVRRR